MFTGIVQGTAEVVAIKEKPQFRTHTLRMPPEQLTGLEPGASVAPQRLLPDGYRH